MYARNDVVLHGPAILVSAIFMVLALLISIILILQHLRSYRFLMCDFSQEQKWIIDVLLMVPVYATESLVSAKKNRAHIISLSNPKTSLACDVLRNCYEAYTLYAFESYLIACLGGEDRVLELLENKSSDILNKPLLEETDANSKCRDDKFCNFFLKPCALGKRLFLAFLLQDFGV